MTDPKPIKSPKPQAPESRPGPASPTPAAVTSPAHDEHHGRGGMYTVVNGQRVLLGRTQAAHEAEAADTTQPATPVNPATTE